MSILTIEEYIEKFKDQYDANHLKGADKTENKTNVHLVKCGMLKWNDKDAECWYGPYYGNYVFFKIEDYSFKYDLKTIGEIREQIKSYYFYRSYNIPIDIVEKVFGSRKNMEQYECNGKQYSRSHITFAEREKILSVMSAEQKVKYIETLQKDMQREEKDWIGLSPSIETPVRLYLCGNDDCSHTRLFTNRENALKELEYLSEYQPEKDYIYSFYVFTN